MDEAKSDIRGKFRVISTHINKKKKNSQINKLALHLKVLEKEPVKPKVSRREEITDIRAELKTQRM